MRLGCDAIAVSALKGTGLDLLKQTLAGLAPEGEKQSLTGSLAQTGDTVLLVMPQDPQAPKGRLILPQVQTLRDLMDKGCVAICCTTEDIDRTLAALREPPHSHGAPFFATRQAASAARIKTTDTTMIDS
jgi:hypothetical protein